MNDSNANGAAPSPTWWLLLAARIVALIATLGAFSARGLYNLVLAEIRATQKV